METKTYKGLISKEHFTDDGNVIHLSSLDDPLGEVLEYEIGYKQVTVRYWITDEEVTKEEATKGFLRTLIGSAGCSFGAVYTEATGYLWTNEEFEVGGHNILEELYSYIGKWLILEVDIQGDPK